MPVLSPPLLFRTAASVLALGLSCGVSPVWAGETIFFPGAPLNPDPVANTPDSLFPGTSLSGNIVTVTGGAVGGLVLGGVTNGNETVADNHVTITGGSVGGDVYGGKGSNSTDNHVIITGGSVTGIVYGGRGANDATGNHVEITGGSVDKAVYGGFGGYSTNGVATDNHVTISNGSVGWSVFGGWSTSGVATGNALTITGGSVTGDVYGGQSSDGAVTDNHVTISNGSVGWSVYGGQSLGGAVTDNRVAISGGSVGLFVYGGHSDSDGVVTGNHVDITGGSVGRSVTGGYSDSGAVTGNSVSVTGGSVNSSVFGGRSVTDVVTGNHVSVSGGSVAGMVYGGQSDSGAVIDNRVAISGGSVGANVYGGLSNSGAATGNALTITGGSVGGGAYGGYGSFLGGVSDNVLTMTGGSVAEDVYGGYSESSATTGNHVTIMGGSVGNVTGGFSATGDATDNSVTIGRGVTIKTGSTLTGGYSNIGDDFTGNKLTLLGWQGALQGVRGFQYLDFMLPGAMANGETVLRADQAILTNGSASSIVNVGFMAGGRGQRVGESFTLIDSSAGSLFTGPTLNATAQGAKGVSLFYDFKLDRVGETLTATITGVSANPQTKALSEGRAAGMAFVGQGADLIAGQGMSNALAATKTDGFFGFGAIGGGSSRYNSGSHVDVDGVSVVAGLGGRASNLLVGAFVEAGWGNYNSHNSFANAASVKGDGDVDYYGGGLLGRYDFANGLYGEGSVRAGRSSTDFSSSDLVDSAGPVRANYDSSGTYYGAHAGLGYIWPVNDRANLDLSTKYLWTHQNSDNVTVANDPIRFESSNSHRWRNGARFNYAVSTPSDVHFIPYAGLAYDYEFDGKAKGSAYGYSLKAPSLEGGTGIGELGVSFRPAKDSGFSVDLGLQGYVGVREGISGSLQAKYRF